MAINNLYQIKDPYIKKRYVWRPKLPHVIIGVLFWLAMMFCMGLAWGW